MVFEHRLAELLAIGCIRLASRRIGTVLRPLLRAFQPAPARMDGNRPDWMTSVRFSAGNAIGSRCQKVIQVVLETHARPGTSRAA